MAIWDSICATYAVLGWVPYLSPQAAVAASRPPCAPCSQHPGPRSGMSAPGSSSSPSCSGCSASYCWVSGELEGGVPVGRARACLPSSLAPAGTVSLLLLIYLVFTSFWPISALYLAWIIFDWDTPEKGGDGRSPPFLQLCRRMESGFPPFSGSIPAWQMGSTMSHLSPIIIMVGRGMRRVCGERFPWVLLPTGVAIISCRQSLLCRWQEAAVPAAMARLEALSGLFPCEGMAR